MTRHELQHIFDQVDKLKAFSLATVSVIEEDDRSQKEWAELTEKKDDLVDKMEEISDILSSDVSQEEMITQIANLL